MPWFFKDFKLSILTDFAKSTSSFYSRNFFPIKFILFYEIFKRFSYITLFLDSTFLFSWGFLDFYLLCLFCLFCLLFLLSFEFFLDLEQLSAVLKLEYKLYISEESPFVIHGCLRAYYGLSLFSGYHIKIDSKKSKNWGLSDPFLDNLYYNLSRQDFLIFLLYFSAKAFYPRFILPSLFLLIKPFYIIYLMIGF